jgi:alpha-D-ribose 1-methylphosphonate 5-triphosphate synthase subunit PhnH
MEALALSGGFSDPSTQSAMAFRQIMTAMARPGEILEVSGAMPPSPLSVAAGTAILTLCDPETPVFLAQSYDTPSVRDWITFHTGAPIVVAKLAQFALGTWLELPLSTFAIGTPEYPDRSATLIVEMDQLSNAGSTLQGPGIKDRATLSLPERAAFQDNAMLFPLGLDFFFTQGTHVAALPRTTKVS